MSPASFTHRENGRFLTDFTTGRRIYLFFSLLDVTGILQFFRKLLIGRLLYELHNLKSYFWKENNLLTFLLHLPQALIMIILGMGLVRVVRITMDWTQFLNWMYIDCLGGEEGHPPPLWLK